MNSQIDKVIVSEIISTGIAEDRLLRGSLRRGAVEGHSHMELDETSCNS